MQSVTSWDKYVLQEIVAGRRKRFGFCYLGRGSAFHLYLFDWNILCCLETVIDNSDSKIVASILVICSTDWVLVNDCLCFARQVSFGSKSRIQLTSIVGHSWPMKVPVCLNFAKVCSNVCAAVCSWLVTEGIFWCRNDRSCLSFVLA